MKALLISLFLFTSVTVGQDPFTPTDFMSLKQKGGPQNGLCFDDEIHSVYLCARTQEAAANTIWRLTGAGKNYEKTSLILNKERYEPFFVIPIVSITEHRRNPELYLDGRPFGDKNLRISSGRGTSHWTFKLGPAGSVKLGFLNFKNEVDGTGGGNVLWLKADLITSRLGYADSAKDATEWEITRYSDADAYKLSTFQGYPMAGFTPKSKGPTDHRDSEIHFIACDESIGQPIKKEDGRVEHRMWTATWNGDNFLFRRGNGDTEGEDHEDSIINYLSFDGSCWQAKWNASKGIFMQRRYPDGQFADGINRIDYLTWDRVKWSAYRENDRFNHIFSGEAEYDKSWWSSVTQIFRGDKGSGWSWGSITPSNEEWVCGDEKLPAGWIVTKVDNIPDSNCRNRGKKHHIFNAAGAGIGSVSNWCENLSVLPAGWKRDSDLGRPGSCGGWNQYTVRKVK